MLYSFTRVATVGVKWLTLTELTGGLRLVKPGAVEHGFQQIDTGCR